MAEALRHEENGDLTGEIAMSGVLRLVTDRTDTELYNAYQAILDDIVTIPDGISEQERRIRLDRIARLPSHGGQSY